MKTKGFIVATFVLMTASSYAWFTDLSSIQGGVLGRSNWNGDSVRYQGTIINDTGAEAWINGIEFVDAVGDWDGISVSASSQLQTRMGSVWGVDDQFSQGFLDGLLKVDYDTNVVTSGLRSGTVRFLGGSDSSAMDELFTHQFSFELADSFDFTHTLNPTSYTVAQGGTSDINATITAGSRDLWAWMFATSGMPDLENSTAEFVNWPAIDPSLGDGFFTGILPAGQTWNGTMFRWKASKDGVLTTPGTFEGGLGVMGGGHVGDQVMFEAPRYSWTVTPVPEPASMTVLGLGLLAAARRRRK